METERSNQETIPALAETFPKPPGTLWVFAQNRMALIAAIVLGGFILIALLAPLIIPVEKAMVMDLDNRFALPSLETPFGTDEFGRDAFVRAIYGGRVTLYVGIVAALLTTVLGVFVGSVAGYFGGRLETILMRFTDLLLGLPFFFVLVLFAAIMRPSAEGIILIYGLLRWTWMARIVRAEFMGLRGRDYVDASRVVGNSNFYIIMREILPNTLGPVVVQMTLSMAWAMLSEASISFLGLGIQPPTPSWGNMLTQAQRYILFAPWLAFFPGMLIFLSVLSFNLVGDGIRDAIDRQMR